MKQGSQIASNIYKLDIDPESATDLGQGNETQQHKQLSLRQFPWSLTVGLLPQLPQLLFGQLARHEHWKQELCAQRAILETATVHLQVERGEGRGVHLT